MPTETIGVVTLTRHRNDMLRRAMASVHDQDFPGEIEHVVVVDDDPDAVPVVEAAPTRPGLRNVAHLVPRSAAERDEPPGDKRYVYPRLSRLFNTGARIGTADWIAFLDDDNEFEPDHLSSLYACAQRNGAEAVHSGRTMWHADGTPHTEEVWHTAPDRAEGERIFALMCDRGVRSRGTNILLDRADPVLPSTLRTSTVLQPEDPVLLVDQSVWLIRRELLLRVPIPETFTADDHAKNAAPDDKLLEALLRAGVRLHTTGRPTVRYYLGGVSNHHRSDPAYAGT
ncbi:glycosyltransferase [Micromonospora sp. SH-82]|uniref:glycosyltransferase family 2 protein n=1 Tax=Micromonospora sp. SH-82 TaxID=3132938 RepID=UPI003EBCF5AF